MVTKERASLTRSAPETVCCRRLGGERLSGMLSLQRLIQGFSPVIFNGLVSFALA
jgi:hypothetical protein